MQHLNGAINGQPDLSAARRRERIAALVSERRQVRTRELAQEFAVSPVSIRNDLNELARRGLLVRTQGGAHAAEGMMVMVALADRRDSCRAAKQAIGQAAAKFLDRPDLRIYIDTGTTTVHLARQVPAELPMILYSNSLSTILALQPRPLVKVIALGGRVDYVHQSMSGPVTDAQVDRLQFDLAFLGAESVAADGFGCADMETAHSLRRIISRSHRVFVLADASKCTVRRSVLFASPEEVGGWITDASVPAQLEQSLTGRGLHVLVAEKDARGPRSERRPDDPAPDSDGE